MPRCNYVSLSPVVEDTVQEVVEYIIFGTQLADHVGQTAGEAEEYELCRLPAVNVHQLLCTEQAMLCQRRGHPRLKGG